MPAPAPPTPRPDDLITATELKFSLGGLCENGLENWRRELNFPPPDFVIRKRRYWYRATRDRWLAEQIAAQKEAAA